MLPIIREAQKVEARVPSEPRQAAVGHSRAVSIGSLSAQSGREMAGKPSRFSRE